MSKQTKALARFIDNLPVEAVIEGTQVTTLSLVAGDEGSTNTMICTNQVSCENSKNQATCMNGKGSCSGSTNGSCSSTEIVKPTNPNCGNRNYVACVNICD